jgi:asparagine synthase (glutamine-hydrolysing)
MPGIAGLITNKPRQEAEPELQRMISALRHEDFYETGTWVDQSLGMYVGWVARTGSSSDGMPMRNARTDVVLIFSGEDFSETETGGGLKEGNGAKAIRASYLVRAYEENSSFPAGLNGRFHGLVINRERGTGMLFNDRYGMHRIYYHESPEGFYFAAEAKAILAVRPELRNADSQALGEFVTYGCVLENRTLFRALRVLPAASAWVFRNGLIESKASYFHPREWEEQARLDPENYYQELRNTLSGKLGRYFNGPQPVALSMTGGLDTRMILACHKVPPGSMPCYTFGSMYRDCRDVVVGRRVAGACGQPHHVIPVGGEFLSRFSHYAERTVYLTDGCADVSRSPDLYVQEKAREIAPVRIAGTYGSEVLRGSRDFKPWQPSPGLFSPELLPCVRAAENSYSELIRQHPVSFAVFKQAPWFQYGVLALEQTQVGVRTPFLDNDIVRIALRAPDTSLTGNEICLRLIADGNPELQQIRTDRGLAGGKGRLSALASRTWLEFTFKAEYAYDYGMPQWLARIDHNLAKLHPERLFLGKHKFYHFRIWYRDALAKYVQEMLLDPKTLSRSYLQRKGLEAMARAHVKGDGNYTYEIHKVLTLELIHRLFVDRT